MDNSVAAGSGAGKFQRSFNRLCPGVGEENLFEVRDITQQPLSKNASQCRYVHLDEIWKIAVENLLKRVAHEGVIAPECKDTPPTQQIEILQALAIIQILAGPPLVAPVESDRFQHANHLFVQMAGVQRVAIGFRFREEALDIPTH